MKTEIRAFFTALMFYTRIPCPKWVDHSEKYLRISRKYFPLIGLLVGGIAGLTLVGLEKILPVSIAVIFSMITSILVTGAFHEDGLADTMDGFGGGWTKEKILAIMKDSRLGTFGAISLMMVLMVKYLLLVEIVKYSQENIFSFEFCQCLFATYLSGHAISRFMALTFFKTHQYAKMNDEIGSKSKPIAKGQFPLTDLFLAAIFALIPMALFQNYLMFLALIPCFLITWILGRWFNKWIGGYTGDCLGAVQQITEVTFYISILTIWMYF
ncbi:adenosylcobinamide-GDP ribazoletransferase [Echinicola pacifica]|uniref:Adenosylcobinamide-GDP ribazoletransferase n=1 Tax=Echinicola pacifica TaxID=346377 RepID=A0A918Q252_9BACT|nr:adenosylcobinamide-GDP ribazoletransferase [Echinicola pacifica]GGZ31218.1 adenosylcobinamide-GDP ribazoletransferase [Echinicola pacifica]